MNREEQVRREIYLFIKKYGEKNIVRLRNIQMYADSRGISRYAMGNAMQELKNKGAIYFIPKRGWISR